MENKEYQTRYKLKCGSNPRDLGIEDEKGNWDMTKFKKHILECPLCAVFTKNLVKEIKKEIEMPTFWQARYRLSDGKWQNWIMFNSFEEAEENMKLYAQGREYEIIPYNWEIIKEEIFIEKEKKEISKAEKEIAYYKKTLNKEEEND